MKKNHRVGISPIDRSGNIRIISGFAGDKYTVAYSKTYKEWQIRRFNKHDEFIESISIDPKSIDDVVGALVDETDYAAKERGSQDRQLMKKMIKANSIGEMLKIKQEMQELLDNDE